jgi:hypothetical protein
MFVYGELEEKKKMEKKMGLSLHAGYHQRYDNDIVERKSKQKASGGGVVSAGEAFF